LYTFAGCGTVISMLILSFLKANQFWQVFFIQGLFMGLAVSFGVQPALTAAGQHFPKKRALAMGLVTSGSAMGGIAFPLMFERLLPVLGYSWTLRIVALKIA
jgi:MCP family monocarboxylic acid transporter-like MFS transporter 10